MAISEPEHQQQSDRRPQQQKIGVMGGMFDPVHKGHLAAAKLAQKALALDVVHLVPCARPNHREQAGVSGADRLNMLELAIAGDATLLADDRELRRPGTSYMVDTLQSFVAEFPRTTPVYILGLDSFYTLPTWHQWQQLLDLCHLAVINRPGDIGPMPDELAQQVNKRLVVDINSFVNSKQVSNTRGRVLILDDLSMSVSSSVIRQALARADMPAELPRTVQAYIRQHKLYFSTAAGSAESDSAGRSHT